MSADRFRWDVPSSPPADRDDLLAMAKWYANICDDGSLRPNLLDRLILEIERLSGDGEEPDALADRLEKWADALEETYDATEDVLQDVADLRAAAARLRATEDGQPVGAWIAARDWSHITTGGPIPWNKPTTLYRKRPERFVGELLHLVASPKTAQTEDS